MSGSRQPAGTTASTPKSAKRKRKLRAPSQPHLVSSLSSLFLAARKFIQSSRKKTARTNPTVSSHGRQQCCSVHQNGTPLRNPRNKGGPTGKSAPPMLLTIKIKNAMCIGGMRPLFILIQG